MDKREMLDVISESLREENTLLDKKYEALLEEIQFLTRKVTSLYEMMEMAEEKYATFLEDIMARDHVEAQTASMDKTNTSEYGIGSENIVTNTFSELEQMTPRVVIDEYTNNLAARVNYCLRPYYYDERQFELALKYYEMAAEYKFNSAYECLGYIWYYGRTGTRDYEKAFKYFSLAREGGNIVAAYKLADMYKNGYYVEKNYEKYCEIIEELYPVVNNASNLGEPLPEIFTRLAKIRSEQGRTNEAIQLYYRAKDFLAQRISYNAFFGYLNIMMWLEDDLYKLTEFDPENFDFYDLYHLAKAP